MKIAQASSRALAHLFIVLGAAACDGPPESAVEVASLRGRATDTTRQADFEVDVSYAGGVTRAQAAALIEHLEIFPARDVMPAAQIPPPSTAADGEDESLDASAPTYAITLRPLNDVAARERYAWAASVDARPQAPAAASGSDGIAERQSALSAGIDIEPETLGYNELWVSANRYRCHSFTVQAEVFAGVIRPCIIQGASGNAGTSCGAPLAAYTSIGDWNPLNEHYFRGGAKGFPGGVLVGIYVVCI